MAEVQAEAPTELLWGLQGSQDLGGESPTSWVLGHRHPHVNMAVS